MPIKRGSLLVVMTGAVLGTALGLLLRATSEPTGPAPAASGALSTGGAAATGRVPRLAMPSRQGRTLELRPDSPDYNPALLNGIVPTYTVFAKEPRVERWAKPVETYLSDRIGAELPRLVPGVQLDRVECRTAICAVSLKRLPGEEGAAVNPSTVRHLLAILYSPAAGAHTPEDLGFMLVYRGQRWFEGVSPDSPGELIAAIEKRRADVLAKIRAQHAQGKPSQYYAVNPEILPER
jgi:hypothetical protein